MENEKPIMNILTYGLPKELAIPIYNEFHNRMKEIIAIINNNQNYNIHKKVLISIELLLALSIFYKRIISNFNGIQYF